MAPVQMLTHAIGEMVSPVIPDLQTNCETEQRTIPEQ